MSNTKYQKLPTENQDGDRRQHEYHRKNYQTHNSTSADDFGHRHETKGETDYHRKLSHNGFHSNSYSSYGNDSFDEYRDNDSDVSLSSGDIEEEDEVFIADPRQKWKKNWEEATKPLMHPRSRRRMRFGNHRLVKYINSHCPDCMWKSIYMVIFLGTLAAFVCLVVYLLETFIKKDETVLYPFNGNFSDAESFPAHDSFTTLEPQLNDPSVLIGCSKIETEDVWTIGIPKLTTESSFRLVDVNQDGILDAIFGFGTGADGVQMPDIVCDLYFQGFKPCGGGIMALDGGTGKELWRHYGKHEMFGVNCNEDLNQDGVPDCLAGGRGGVFEVVSGKNGKMIWSFQEPDGTKAFMNFYTAQFTRDLNGDGVLDVLTVHGGDPMREKGEPVKLAAHLMILSGKDGALLQDVEVPDRKESYYSPQIVNLRDGEEMVLFGTGGETHGGSLWVVSLGDLYSGDINKATRVLQDGSKGVMTPPALVDLNKDGVEDIVIPLFNSSVFAIDGSTYDIIWQRRFENSESYNSPSVGFFNNDDTPDFMVKYANGPGFPVYLYSVTTILDGRTGAPLLDPFIKDSIGSQSSPLTISVEGHGNDIFLYWLADCLQHPGREQKEFHFTKGTNVHEQTRADFCKMRFNSKIFTALYARNRHSENQGTQVYNSVNNSDVEHSAWVNTTEEALDYVLKHPDIWNDYLYHTDVLGKKEHKEVGQETETTISPHTNDKAKKLSSNTLRKQQQNEQPSRPVNHGDADENIFANPVGKSEQKSDSNFNGKNKLESLLDEDTLKSYFGLTGNSDTGYDIGDGVPRKQDRPYVQKPKNPMQKYLTENYPNIPSGYLNSDLDRSQYPTDQQPDYRYWTAGRNGGRKSNGWDRGDDYMYVPRNYEFLSHGRRQKRSNRSNMKLRESDFKHLLQRGILSNGRPTDKMSMQFAKISSRKGRGRRKRHIGPHDDGGIQRLISTGTLAPPLLDVNHPDYNHSMDVIFATYWFYPTKTKALFPEDQACVDAKMKNPSARFDSNSKYYGMDSDAYEDAVQEECLTARDSSSDTADHTYSHPSNFNPYSIPMGQLTVYRKRIKCKCKSNLSPNEQCGKILPFEQQQWAAYMGTRGDSHWIRRPGQ